jgi:nucleotide-binding universal stress UspA family protein
VASGPTRIALPAQRVSGVHARDMLISICRKGSMAFKDALLALATYPEPTPVPAVEDAVELAAAIGARISAIACEVTIQVPGSVLGSAFLDIPGMAAAERRKSAVNAQNLLAAFQRSAEKRGVFQDSILDHCPIAESCRRVAGYARLHDLTIVPASGPGFPDASFAEAIIFGSGRTTIVTPAARPRARPFALDAAVVAWDSSRSAARALADALPILAMAKEVHILTVVNEKDLDTARSGGELASHLSRHGIDGVAETIDAAGRDVGSVLEAYVESRGADLLVMGAFGHSRLREFVLGGATRSMLAHPPVPILMSH